MKTSFNGARRVAVGLSGGADSAAVATLAVQAVGAENVVCYTCINPHVFRYEIDSARKVAEVLGVSWMPFTVDLPNEALDVSTERCYYCKQAVFGEIRKLASRDGCDLVCDGTRADDDLSDRPGMKAIKQLGVSSPLKDAGLTRADVMEIVSVLGIEFHDESCVATRIMTGYVTLSRLSVVEQVEDVLRGQFPSIRFRDFGTEYRVEFKKPRQLSDAERGYIRTVAEQCAPGAVVRFS